MKDIIQKHLEEGLAVRRAVLDACVTDIEKMAQILIETVRAGACIYLFGNGGSAADAQHIEGELTGRYLKERPAIRARAITTNTTALTAIANDYGYEEVFARQLQLVTENDAVVGISTSGRSPNVVKGLQEARQQGAHVLALTGRHSGPVGAAAHVCVAVPSECTPLIQEMHIAIGHICCHLIEDRLYG